MSSRFKLLFLLGACMLMIFLGLNRSYRDVQTLPLHFSTAMIHFYKKNISVAGSPDCVFYPSCSLYAKEALKKYGLIRGWLMSFDRMTRCNNEEWFYPKISFEDKTKKYDPVI